MTPLNPPPDQHSTDIYGAAMPASGSPNEPDPALLHQVSSGANWFYWIGGLSLVNSLIAHFGGSFSFIVGLGISQVVDYLLREMGGTGGIVVALAFDVFAAAVCCLFGWLANKRMTWVFWVGMTLYAADGLIFILAQGWLSLAFHAYALFCISQGARASAASRRMG